MVYILSLRLFLIKKCNLNELYVLPPKKSPDVLFTFEADENSLSCEIHLTCYKEEDIQPISGRISVHTSVLPQSSWNDSQGRFIVQPNRPVAS